MRCGTAASSHLQTNVKSDNVKAHAPTGNLQANFNTDNSYARATATSRCPDVSSLIAAYTSR